jgi:16S rRNA (uracil1498-N3)-methyltransferase
MGDRSVLDFPLMPDLRAYAVPSEVEPRQISLDADESHHLLRVNRARTGDTVVVFDGQGREWVCELRGEQKGRAELAVRFGQKARPLPYRITLAQAVPKGRHMADIVRKATEIGVSRVVPLLSERTIVQVESDREEGKVEKWQEAALEACKQCGNSYLPEILPAARVGAFLDSVRGQDLLLIASLQPGAKSLRSILAQRAAEGKPPPRQAVWMVGPEGDFTPAEMSAARNAGFEPVTLGPLVLRCETAAVYALSILSYELQG